MRRIAACAAAGLLLAAGGAPALTFFDLATGDEALLPDARSVALGRTRAVDGAGAFSAMANPAWLPRQEGLAVMLGGSVLKLKESRSTPAYDSFDGYLVESIYVLNDEYQLEGGAGASIGFDFLDGRWGLGVTRAPLRDFQYDYSEEVRDNDGFTQPRDELLAVNEVQSDGRLDAWSIGAAGEALPWLDIGGTVQIVDGDQDLLVRTRWMQEDIADFVRTEVSNLEGLRWMAGALWRPHHAVSAGVVFRSDMELEGDLREEVSGAGAVQSDADVKYPLELTVGAAWRPRAKLRTTVRAEGTFAQWSQFESSRLAGLELEDVWDARLGIEHVFYNGFPVRFGIRYAPSPVDDEVATTAFTFGAGFTFARVLRADVAFEVASRRYRFEDLFDDALFGGDTRIQKDLVEESGTSAFLTLGTDWTLLGG